MAGSSAFAEDVGSKGAEDVGSKAAEDVEGEVRPHNANALRFMRRVH
jgi:hypothetical protein